MSSEQPEFFFGTKKFLKIFWIFFWKFFEIFLNFFFEKLGKKCNFWLKPLIVEKNLLHFFFSKFNFTYCVSSVKVNDQGKTFRPSNACSEFDFTQLLWVFCKYIYFYYFPLHCIAGKKFKLYECTNYVNQTSRYFEGFIFVLCSGKNILQMQ